MMAPTYHFSAIAILLSVFDLSGAWSIEKAQREVLFGDLPNDASDSGSQERDKVPTLTARSASASSACHGACIAWVDTCEVGCKAGSGGIKTASCDDQPCFTNCDHSCLGGCNDACIASCDSGSACFSSCDKGCWGSCDKGWGTRSCDKGCTTGCDSSCAVPGGCDSGCVSGCDEACSTSCDDGCTLGCDAWPGYVQNCLDDCENTYDGCLSTCAVVSPAFELAVEFGEKVGEAVVEAYEWLAECITDAVTMPTADNIRDLAKCARDQVPALDELGPEYAKGSIAGVLDAVKNSVTDIPQMVAERRVTRDQCEAIFLHMDSQLPCLQETLRVVPTPGLCLLGNDWSDKTLSVSATITVPNPILSQIPGLVSQLSAEVGIYVNHEDKGCFVAVAGSKEVSTTPFPAAEAGGAVNLWKEPGSICGASYVGELGGTLFGIEASLAVAIPAKERNGGYSPDFGTIGLDKIIGLSGSLGTDSSGFELSAGFTFGVANLVSLTRDDDHGCTIEPLEEVVINEVFGIQLV